MSLPIILPAGLIAVYGAGNGQDPMPSGARPTNGFLFGTVYNIWDGGATYIYGGDVVFWKDGTQVCRIATTENLEYTLIPARLVTKDFIVP